MNRVVLMALAGLLFVTGCSQANSPMERQEKRADIESARKQAEDPESRPQLATHHVTKKETCHIASQTARCYSVSTSAKSREDLTTLTQHFRNRSSGPDTVVLNQEVNEAMQNDGVYVLTVEDKIEQQACEGWDPGALGPPPERWDCPGY
jgi:PBP1b-binding outer membrane lipoprotein LpoB